MLLQHKFASNIRSSRRYVRVHSHTLYCILFVFVIKAEIRIKVILHTQNKEFDETARSGHSFDKLVFPPKPEAEKVVS